MRGTPDVDAEWEDIVEETQGTEAKRRALISHFSSRRGHPACSSACTPTCMHPARGLFCSSLPGSHSQPSDTAAGAAGQMHAMAARLGCRAAPLQLQAQRRAANPALMCLAPPQE